MNFFKIKLTEILINTNISVHDLEKARISLRMNVHSTIFTKHIVSQNYSPRLEDIDNKRLEIISLDSKN